jgi:hypothetical protein
MDAEKTWAIGDGARAWAGAMLRARGVAGIRVLNGLLALRNRHPSPAINTGCKSHHWRLKLARAGHPARQVIATDKARP